MLQHGRALVKEDGLGSDFTRKGNALLAEQAFPGNTRVGTENSGLASQLVPTRSARGVASFNGE
jgi:hypothetical protein